MNIGLPLLVYFAPNPIAELDADFEGSAMRQKSSLLLHRRSFQSLSRSLRIDGDIMVPQSRLDRRFSVCERVSFGSRPSDFDPNFRWCGSSDDENFGIESPSTVIFSPMSYGYGDSSVEERERPSGKSRYCSVASKQMVGIFLTVWVRSEIRDDVKNLKVSCVGRGLMGYLGNKFPGILLRQHQADEEEEEEDDDDHLLVVWSVL
ncbi:type IV inositol polyphosphate 5-phosphatase 7-like, partial [Phoenix dactylifera]|uniref:Type IV inositol polyphosphate 5-phosphatase 7-like n=1 Tax=Phoenix dactylifera TaxID=42345 RepID=A0A8B8ZT69_PHODC